MADDMGTAIGNVAVDRAAARLENEIKIPYADLREWLEEAEKLGEVKHVEGANWERDIGMAAEVVLHDPKAPCVVFDDVPGTLKGSRVLCNFFSGKRMNMTLGFPSELSKIELTDAFRENYMEDLATIPHQFVDDGPVLENVMEGDDVDVEAFPTPLWHEEDGGRYIGTGSYNVTADPDTGWINVGTYRVMVHDQKSVGFYISPGKHGRVHRDKYQQRGEAMPAVIVVGGDGSMLGAGRALCRSGTPVLGINRGRLGFLTDILPDEVEENLLRVIPPPYRRHAHRPLRANSRGGIDEGPGIPRPL